MAQIAARNRWSHNSMNTDTNSPFFVPRLREMFIV
jgi:hypothetical protein